MPTCRRNVQDFRRSRLHQSKLGCDKATHAYHALCRARVLEEIRRRKGTPSEDHLKFALTVIDERFAARTNSPAGTIGIFVCEAVFRHASTKRSLNMTANWVFASNHSRGGRFQSAAAWFKTKYSSFAAASSDGKWPLVLTARRSLEFSASIAFVV